MSRSERVGNRARSSLLVAVLALMLSAPATIAQTQLLQTSARNTQMRPDSARITNRARNLQATFERRRRQMLPKFYPGRADRCLIVGRFCEWHPNVTEEYVVPNEGRNIVRARAELLRDLEKASAALPGDDWIMGQRVRYLTEGHDTSAASVARACRATKWWCDALLGLALHVEGNFAAADSAYAAALVEMPALTRCHWLNLTPLLDDDIRGTYKKMTCEQREAADARIWWVSDPLFMTPGNERRTEHFSRVLHTALQQNAENTYGSSWGGDLAELILRFGWAEKWTQEPPANMLTNTKAAITGHEREPGFHFFLTQQPPDSVALIVDSVFDIYQFPPREQYAPVYTRAFVRLDAQVARFRRGDSTKVVAAYDVSADTIFGQRPFTAALIASGDERTAPSKTEMAASPAKNVLTVSTPWKEQLVGVELLANDSAGAARWRSGFAEIPLDSGKISVSDLLFVDGAPSLPGDLDEAIPRAHGGTKFSRDQKIGLFWELYGSAPADSALPISLTITPVDESLLRRAFRALRIAPKLSPLNIRWQENGASGVLSARSVLLDLSLVPAGKYAVKLEVGNSPTAATSRIIEVK
ncbi:MAG TPA: hypothetical protein VK481_13455 [Gemmatimonadaceae bacterium]|nr:hypothetical protein [Gemmatimonadaceae bacterium]